MKTIKNKGRIEEAKKIEENKNCVKINLMKEKRMNLKRKMNKCQIKHEIKRIIMVITSVTRTGNILNSYLSFQY